MLDCPGKTPAPKLQSHDIWLLDFIAVLTAGMFRANLSDSEDGKKLNGAISLNCIFEVGDEKSCGDEKSARRSKIPHGDE